jgi:hypothetical protein
MSVEKKPTTKKAENNSAVKPSIQLVRSFFMENAETKTPSFAGIPVTEDCPYLELIFNPKEKILGIISKQKKQMLQSVPKLDNNGFPKVTTNKQFKDAFPFQQERILMETYHEYYITDANEIKSFLQAIAVNPEFNYNEFL